MNQSSLECWTMAQRKIGEARRMDPVETPEALIMISYYAMHHAARAVLIASIGAAPKTHDAVIGAFCRLIKDDGDDAKAAGRAMNAAFDTRCSANYDTRYDVDSDTAREVFEAAERFLRLCLERLDPPIRDSAPTDTP